MIGGVNWPGEIYMMYLSRRMNSKKGTGGELAWRDLHDAFVPYK
jgi:hypothetical protein